MYIFYQDRIFNTHECVNLVVLLPFSHLPLPLPLPIFSAQFAYFRQRKTKSDITQSQKKTAKRKGSSVHTHDVPKEEYALAAQDVGKGIESKAEETNLLQHKAEDTNLLETTTETEGSADLSNWDVLNDHAAEKVTINSAAEYSELDAKVCQARIADLENRLLEKQEAVKRLTAQMEELQQQLTQHSDSMQLQETTVREQNEVIRKLTSCLQQTKKDRDDLQEEASRVAGQIHDLQLQLHQVNEMLRNKSHGKNEVSEAQQQMSLFQNHLREQNQHLEMLRQKAYDLEVQLESSQKNTKDKENLLAQMEEDMKDTMQQLYKSIEEKDQHIKSLQDLLTSERFSLSILQHTLSLRDSEITELRNEIALSKMKERQCIEELKISHEKDICKQLENLRAELEKCHRREIAEAKQAYVEETLLKYKNELEQLKKELCALNSEEHIQNLNGIIIDLNNSLCESEINKENLRKKLENQQEDFQREKSEIETKYKNLIDGLKSQLSDAEEQVKEAQQYKQEKQSLNEEIQNLNSFIQKLNEKRLYEAEKSIDVGQKHDEEIVSNKKLMKLRENEILPEVLQLQRGELEEMWNKPHQLKGEGELVHEELEFQCDLGVDSSRDQLEEIKNSDITENNENSEGDKLSEEHLSELGLFSGVEGILAKYLISTERPEESYASSTSEGYAIEEGTCSRYGLDSSVLLEPSRDFIPPSLNLVLDEETCPSRLAQETFEETEVGAEAFVSSLSDSSPQQNKISDHNDVKDDETACLVERCVKLTEQLHKKESALMKSYKEAQEAVGKWEKVMAELSHMHVELDEEREARIRCEKELLQKTEKEKELENKIMFLVKQQGVDGGQHYCAVEPLTQVSTSSTWQEMVKDLQKEREMLMVQLRTQEQLVKDVQEQKTAADSVTSEVQSLFGRQLAALQSQRDQMQSQLDAQKAKNQTIAELLGQKTISEETLLKEQELLKAEIDNKEQNLAIFLKEKTTLGERLSDVKEDLIKAQKALAENASIIEGLEKNIHELNAEVKSLQEIRECERLGYEDRLNFSNLEIHKLNAEIKAKSTEYSEEKSQLTKEIAHLKKAHVELETRLQESLQSAQALQETRSKMVKHYKEEMDKLETQRLAELTKIEELNAEIKDKVEKQQKLEEEKKEQIALIKKVHEREHDREISELITKHEEEMEKLRAELNKEHQQLLDELRQQMAATHKAEIEQAQLQSQALHSLELEALRLSLNNMHTSQLELTQSNLRKERETALVELREMLNDKRSQEVAILQSRHQLEWEKIKEQCLKEKEDLKSKYQQELVDQRKKIELEMEETHTQALETLKRDWELESDVRLKNTCEELSEKHQAEMVELQKTLEMELEKVKAELGLLSLENEQSKIKCIELEKQHQVAIIKLQEQLQTEHNQLLEDMKMKSQEKEQNLQKELEKLQVMHEELKTQSQEEIRQLWSQLDSTRANRQDLSDGETKMQARGPELKEQLLARASRVEEIERLKQEFEQQRQQRKSEHETELEQLRLYFEKKLRVAEENYREELTLLHQRLQELKEYSLSELVVSQDQAGDISSSVAVFEENAEKESRDALGQLNQQLEQHQEELACLEVQLKEKHRHELDSLRSSLALQYKEDLMKMKMDLSDKYITEIEEMKRKHCLELEQLRARLSEEHIKEITKLRLQSARDTACQVEMEVAERVSVLEEEHKAKLSLLHSEKEHIAELSEEIKHLKEEITRQKDFSVQNEKHLKEEMEEVKYKIAEDHMNKLREAREEVQKIETMYKEKEKRWKCESEDQRIQAEEKLSLLRIELQNKAEYEKQNLQKEFELREAEMNQLQDHQAAKILELEKLVKEQQNNLQQLEDSLASAQAMQKSQEQYDTDLQAAKALMAKEMEKATLCLQEECARKLMEAQNKFMEEHKAMTQKFTTEQEIILQELKKKHVNELELQRQQLQDKHKQQILSLTAEFQSKHQAEMETLKSTLESKQQIQLEACVAELQTKHQAQIDELEAKHLSNLDSLESSYLSEIQNIRDEHSQALEKLQLQHTEQLHEKDKMDQACLAQEIEMLKLKHAEELQLSQNNLKIELATVHMEKLKAMAVEAEEAHKDDLNTALQNQRRLLEEEKRLALDILREEVLHMEEKHRKALQEFQDLHEAEIKKHKEEFSRELQEELGKLKAQHEHEQEMYASASASEVETVRTALLAEFEEVKLKQQLQFQEEIELLKCQSEVLLEQQIAQLKDEFEAEKKASLHDKEQMLIQEREKAQAAHQKEQEMLSAQLQEKAAIIIQLEKKVESLNREIEETNSELETLLQQRERENQEGGNLVAMLRSDIEQSKDERKKLQESYQHVLKLLMELVKATIAVEDLICSKIGLCLDDSLASGDSRESHGIMDEMGFMQCFKAKEKHHLEKACLFSVDELLDETLAEHNQLSPVTDEESELSQYLCESVFAKPELACENEEMILKICHRLHAAVERLLELVTESTKQLEKMHENHVQFEEEFSRRKQETAEVVSQHQELMECLSEESEAKNQLALELHKAEGIIEGYVAEKAALEEALNLKEESERRLVVELESMRERFQELTQEQAILGTPIANVAQKEGAGLLKEVEFLAKEKLELQCQAEKDHSNLRSQMKVLEVELEEQLHSNQDLATQLLEVAELKQQIQVLEKQLKNQRQFMDEQAIEREHERDDFQQEIQKLEEQLKLSAKSQMSGEPREYRNYELILQVESLQAEIKEKMDDYNKLLLEKEQKHQEIAARDKEIEKLVAQIRELEHSSTEVSKTVHYLEQQLQKMKKVETELKQDKEALQQQQYNNLIQISALQSKLDEARHRVPADGSSAPVLKEQLQAEQEALQMKEREIASLLDQLGQYKDNLISKNKEILQLNLQLEMQKNLSTSTISQLQLENAHLKEDLTKLQVKQNQDLGISDSSALSFPQALLKEKNQEIDHLNEQMKRLQHELENTLENKVVEDQKSEIEELRSLVEHLRGDQERLRKDKDEEVEQLHGVIEKLQKELAQFGPVCHEVSDNQDDFYQLALGKPVENLQNELRKGLVDCQDDIDPNRRNALLLSKVRELQEELELLSTAREALQQQLEEKEMQFKMEVEILEKKCQKLRESSEQHIAELTSLRIQYDELQEEYSLFQTHFSQREVEARMTTSRIPELEDTVRERETNILEKDMQMKTMADQKEADTTELQYLTKKAGELQTELEKRDASRAQDVYSLQLEVSRLDFQKQALNEKEVAYQREINELQSSTAKLKDQIKAYVKELEALQLERGELVSCLKLYKPKEQRDHEETNLLQPFCWRERKGEALGKGAEELEKLEANGDQSFSVLASPPDKLEKGEVMFDLTTHNINPKTQIKQSQENILTQELDTINNSEEEQDLKKHCQQMLEIHQTPDSPKHTLKDFQNFIAGMASWGSPEIVRKQDTSMDLQPVLQLTPFSEVESTDFELMHTRSSVQEDNSVLLGYSNLYENDSEEAAVGVDRKSPAFSESTYSIDDDQDMEKILQMREADNLTLTPSDLQDDVRSRASAIDMMSDGYGSNTSSNLAAKLKQELQTSDHLDASFMAYLRYRGIFPDIMESKREKEILSPQLKTVLKMVYEESRKILALSECPFSFRELKNVHQTRAAMEGWQNEGLALLDAIQSLKDYLSKVADRGDKEFSGIAADWRGELLQAVQSVFEKERNVLQIDLKSHFSNPGSGDEGSLVEKLEYIMKQQEEQRQMVVEHLFSSDRNSLLSEIQDLRAQLRMTHLQNQEKLQQLQETLTNAEDHGSKQEHHLRRKVELLEYKLQQEKSIVSDLHSTLSEEQKRASETCDLLNQEKAALKSELYESKQENERLQKSLEELRREISQLCFELEKKEKDLTAAHEDLQSERLKETELQGLFEEQQLQHKKAEGEKTKALEELQAALESQSVQNSQLAVSLEHERTVNDNLRKELQIEHSRCEALLSQEQTKLSELQRNLDAEKNRSLELLNSLNHERVLTEQLSMRVKEGACQHRESLLEQAFVRELQAQLEEERSRTIELAAIIEKTHQATIHSKRQLEAKVQMCCKETQKEREVSDKLRATLESLQGQKQEVIRSLEVQKEREAKLKADWEQLQSLFKTMKEQDKNKKEERERARRQQQQTELEKQKDWQRDQERLQNLERQHQRDEQRIKELQEILTILEERERNLPSPNHQQVLLCTLNKDRNAKQAMTKESEKLHLQQQQQQLEKIRQQLLFVAVHLNEFIYKTIDKTANDWSASNDEAVVSLLQTLKELKSDLLSPPASQIRSMDDTGSVQELERDAWQQERNILQNALKQAESKLAKVTGEIENKPVVETSSPKLQRLYRKYLRAESFRKALVYQKKYLLLLLGGFQDCEQATLSLIARMGIYPSPADLQLSGSRSRPFTKFRCAVRAIIAVSRLKFLVKKWNKFNRKNGQGETFPHSIGGNTTSGARTEILKEQQPPSVHVGSPPTRDTGLCHRTSSARIVSHSPRSSYCLHNRLHPSTSSASEKSLVPPQDPEQSLTEYIHHLEVIQQRLGGAQPDLGQVPGPARQRNMKK
ncbi:pericentrin isoform X3 [Aquila chrysaetos chrysaetos]|uniref:pericentrin isoform X3 n=1 Tax=Aquila chrysaetos chrysaetos TaxID=223781 RepID=UPI001B7D306E|nr:pericentrin isoform X3 [Aquila chrysaetos chrysaetos]